MNNKKFNHDDAYKTLETINMWINNVDTKAATVLGIVGVAFSIVFSSDTARIVKHIVEKQFTTKTLISIILDILLVISIVVVALGIGCIFLTLSPQIIKKPKENNVETEETFDSIMFYAIISKYNYNDYEEKIKNNCEQFDDLMKDLIFQIHSAAKICTKKFNYFKKGLWLFLLGSITMLLILMLSYYVV